MTDRQPPTLPECEQQAVDSYFAGDVSLFVAFRQSCLEQFDVDVAEGDAAIEDQDAATLRRVAHSLKGVLRTMGYDALSDRAKWVENAAHQNQWETAVSQWHDFVQGLRKAFHL